jgi:pyruvate dehydrogenase E1 component alpha subunit
LYTKDDLIEFEEDIAREWEAGHIKAPVHLVGGNEDHLIDIFKDIKPEDWVFSTHRSHYHALLKGVPQDDVKKAIMDGNSISLRFPKYNFYTSAIVGGNLPLAVGTALSGHRTWAFTGDMGACTGIFSECLRFSERRDLPITFVIEHNGMSVCTPTEEVWAPIENHSNKVILYRYKNRWPHQGTGIYVSF